MAGMWDGVFVVISIHAPLAGRDALVVSMSGRVRISIHAPLAGRDDIHAALGQVASISIHAPLAGRDLAVLQRHRQPLCISIHAPLAGRDIKVLDCTDEELMISIHAPLAGRDICTVGKYPSRNLFQSTRPLRGATFVPDKVSAALGYFNPRAIVGGKVVQLISIHAPLAGRDFYHVLDIGFLALFQSTRPLRGATARRILPCTRVTISIHAPLAGRDGKLTEGVIPTGQFQSTRPLRGATALATT